MACSLEARRSSAPRLHRSAPRAVAQTRSWRWGCSPTACPQLRGQGGDGKDRAMGQRGSTGSPASLLGPRSCWAPFTPGTPFASSTSAATPRRLPPSPGPAVTNTLGGAQTCPGFPHVTGTQGADCPHLLPPQGQGLLGRRSHGRCRGDPTTAPCPSRAVTNVPVTRAAARRQPHGDRWFLGSPREQLLAARGPRHASSWG